MQIPCPACHRTLAVPDGSLGRRARCPACDHRFIVPDVMEETISAWIVADTEQMRRLRQRHAALTGKSPRQ